MLHSNYPESTIWTRVKRTALSRSCPSPVFVRIFRKVLSGVCPVSGFCQNLLSGVSLSGFCLSRFCPVSGFCHDFSEKVCPVSVCPAGRTRTRQRCPDFHCRCPLNSDLNKETVIEKEKFDERVIDSAFEKIIESKTEDLETHFVYAGFHYTDSKLKSLILKVMKKYNFKMVMVTVLFIERKRLITKERMEN